MAIGCNECNEKKVFWEQGGKEATQCGGAEGADFLG